MKGNGIDAIFYWTANFRKKQTDIATGLAETGKYAGKTGKVFLPVFLNRTLNIRSDSKSDLRRNPATYPFSGKLATCFRQTGKTPSDTATITAQFRP